MLFIDRSGHDRTIMVNAISKPMLFAWWDGQRHIRADARSFRQGYDGSANRWSHEWLLHRPLHDHWWAYNNAETLGN